MFSKMRSDIPKEINFDYLERGIVKRMDFITMYAVWSWEAANLISDI